jgi:hypothetical protein
LAKNDENGKGPTQCPPISQHASTEPGSTATIAESYARGTLALEIARSNSYRPWRKVPKLVAGEVGMIYLDVCKMECGE